MGFSQHGAFSGHEPFGRNFRGSCRDEVCEGFRYLDDAAADFVGEGGVFPREEGSFVRIGILAVPDCGFQAVVGGDEARGV